MEDETFERIPWEHLSGSRPPRDPLPRKTIVYAVAAAVAIAGITALVTSSSDASAPTTSLATVTTARSISLTSTTLLTEASLLAVPRAPDEAAAWAEWVTEAYLTFDGSGLSQAAAYFPPGTPLPVAAPDVRVFVEAAQTLSVTEEGSSYRALVIARLLGATGSEPYKRLPDRALLWTLQWSPVGWVLLDLPEEVSMPALLPGAGFVNAAVPEPVMSAASQHGSVVGGGLVNDLWRVVIETQDQLGGTWPTVMWFDPDGSPVTTSD